MSSLLRLLNQNLSLKVRLSMNILAWQKCLVKARVPNNYTSSARICKECMKMQSSITFTSPNYRKTRMKMRKKIPRKSRRNSSPSLKSKQRRRNPARGTKYKRSRNLNAQINETCKLFDSYVYIFTFQQ